MRFEVAAHRRRARRSTTPRAFRIAVLVAISHLGCATERLAPPAPHLPERLAAFGRLPNLAHVALSPDGSRLAFLKTSSDNQLAVAIVSVSDRALLGTVRMGNEKVRDIAWLDDDQVLISTTTTAVPRGFSGGRGEWLMLQVYDLAAREVRPY